jgi:hypothetical protein
MCGIRMLDFPWDSRVFVSVSSNDPNQDRDNGSNRQQQPNFPAIVVRVHELAPFVFRKCNGDDVRLLWSQLCVSYS